jgi:hypothetical protein
LRRLRFRRARSSLASGNFHAALTTNSANCELVHVASDDCRTESGDRPGYAARHGDGQFFNRHQRRIDEETSMLSETHSSIYESHWMRHADRYLALVRTALEKDPNDLELRELLDAMEAAVAAKQKQPLH